MRRFGLWLVVAAVILLPRVADAKLLDLYLQLDPIGMSTGWRLAGNNLATDNSDFFHRNQGGVTGFKAGIDVLFLEALVDFKQGFDRNGWESYYLAALAGLKFKGNLDGPNNVGYLAVDVGFGLGSAGPFNPPVDNAHVSQKGLIAVARLGYDRMLNSVLSIGFEGDVGYHYLLLGGAAVAGQGNQNVQGVHVIGMVNLKLTLGI